MIYDICIKKTMFSFQDLKILWPKVTKILQNFKNGPYFQQRKLNSI